MRIAAIVLLVGVMVITCGCTSPAPAVTPTAATAQAPPDLTGTWKGPTIGYYPGVGYTDFDTTNMSMIVSSQQGRIFAGTLVFAGNYGTNTVEFSGVIGRDGRTLSLPQKTGGYAFGEITGPGEIELVYVDDGMNYTSAIDTLRKV
jgi:hypothetical protein